MTGKPVLQIELNEVSFPLVRRYIDRGHLPTFAALIDRHGCTQTLCGEAGDNLEPWIQWVTAHTGMPLAEHGVFRLGDIVHTDLPQIWERLEQRGLRVGAFSPMNAKHRLEAPAFFLPDPWTATGITASPLVRRIHAAIAQGVNDNAAAKLPIRSIFWLAAGLVRFAAPANYRLYLQLAARALRRSWSRAAIVDLLMADIFCALCRRRPLDFASLFLNGAAHVQHHYFHSSAVVEAGAENPHWYCPEGVDPVLEIYRVYDRILARLRVQFPEARLLIATGLSQIPHKRATFYWRLKDHRAFLEGLDIRPKAVSARMSRDFVAEFETSAEAQAAMDRLSSIKDPAGGSLFEVDNRGRDLFITLSYASDIAEDFTYMAGNRSVAGLRQAVVFVALKNGEHDGIGSLVDTGVDAAHAPGSMELSGLAALVEQAVSLRRFPDQVGIT